MSKSTININKHSTKMPQNINIVYVLMQNASVLPPGERDQLPPSSLQGAISMHRMNPGGRAISDHKLNMGFTQAQTQKKMYTEWRNCTKDQMIARGFPPRRRMTKCFPDADFLPIYTGMRIVLYTSWLEPPRNRQEARV